MCVLVFLLMRVDNFSISRIFRTFFKKKTIIKKIMMGNEQILCVRENYNKMKSVDMLHGIY